MSDKLRYRASRRFCYPDWLPNLKLEDLTDSATELKKLSDLVGTCCFFDPYHEKTGFVTYLKTKSVVECIPICQEAALKNKIWYGTSYWYNQLTVSSMV